MAPISFLDLIWFERYAPWFSSHTLFSVPGELYANCWREAFMSNQVWWPELHHFSSSASRNPSVCKGQEARYKGKRQFMGFEFIVTLSFIWFMIYSNKAGGVSAVSQKPWTLHPHWQEASWHKLFCREGSEQPEEEESPGLPVTYPVAAPSLAPELNRLPLYKKDIRPPSKVWDTVHFKTCTDSDPETCQFTSGGRVGEWWRTGHDWYTGTARGQFRLFTGDSITKMMQVLQFYKQGSGKFQDYLTKIHWLCLCLFHAAHVDQFTTINNVIMVLDLPFV